ncbi:TIGR02452 family protein [Nocardiopsis mangrovi]|uniref:TIGR02452 family protein n=1 Tax=Nocardiopsis mangrovi TaxID=1179818 RepID=A0ABV9DZ92_9ACTN
MRARWQETREAFTRGWYAAEGVEADISAGVAAMRAGTRLYSAEDVHGLPAPRAAYTTRFEVTVESTLEAAARLSACPQDSRGVAALNFASARNPGGGVANGARAQEESLARSSALYDALVRCPGFYDTHRRQRNLLYTDQVIYAPSVPVFRTDNGRWLADPYPVAFLTSAAPNRRMIERDSPQDAHAVPGALLSRAGGVLAVAAYHERTRLVLGAWGCGVFGNRPAEVADAFAHHLLGAFEGVFEHVVFAILDRDDAVRTPFHAAFGVPPAPPPEPGVCTGGPDRCTHHRTGTAANA